MKFNTLSLYKKLSLSIVLSLFISMSFMAYLSFYFYKTHFEQEAYEDLRSTADVIIDSKLYILKDMKELKNQLITQGQWCYSSYPNIEKHTEILISKGVPDIVKDSIYYSVLIEKDRWLSIYLPRQFVQEEYTEYKLVLILSMLSILLVTSYLVLRYVRHLIEPLSCLTKLCINLKNESPSLPLCYTSTPEISTLYEALITLLNKNRQLYESRIGLFKEAAHELKAPLAIMQARLNLLQEDKNYNLLKYEKETNHDIKLINSKLKELLFLKEIEFDIQEEPLQDICMMQECKHMQERFKRLAQLKNIRIQTDWTKTFILITHEKAIRKVMQAIFENVFIHSPAESVILVRILTEEKTMIIENEVDTQNPHELSSHIGLKIIQRLSKQLEYKFFTSSKNNRFTTTIQFLK
ncbi:HAMP domain-containing histidine kinase [Sulfurimonas sp. MAG313]|nr:HAMP domain-containing sensor histidine kinase [Sulfurimonas sp. MAG313]MDF1881103.1 HAMP domain-containing histidine kinase [Sulfurimonas sp. MAG313]